MKLLATTLITLAAVVQGHADVEGCVKTAPHWVKGPVHGRADNFSPSCFEPAKPSPGLRIAYDSAGPLFSDFDQHVDNRHFIHTMNRFPADIVGATLTIRATDTSAGSNTDSIALRFINPVTGAPDTNLLWRRTLGPWNGDEGLQPEKWGWGPNTGDGYTFTLDLCDLPMSVNESNPNVVSDLIPLLNLYEHLDIVVQDDTKVDFVELELTYCCGTEYTAYGFPECDPNGTPSPFLWAWGCLSTGGLVNVGLESAESSQVAGLFLGLGNGTVSINPASTLDVLPLIGAPVMVSLDQEGEFELSAVVPPVTVTGISLNMQAVILNPLTGGLRSSNAVSFSIE